MTWEDVGGVLIPLYFEGAGRRRRGRAVGRSRGRIGRFDLAARAGMMTEAVIDPERETATALVVDATCGRPLCRAKRWLRAPTLRPLLGRRFLHHAVAFATGALGSSALIWFSAGDWPAAVAAAVVAALGFAVLPRV